MGQTVLYTKIRKSERGFSMDIAICTLGCKVNQYETQAMESELRRRGHALVAFDERADAYIINTCTVTAVSDHKSRQMIRQAKKRGGVVAVCGCYAQTKPEEIAALEVDLVGGASGRLAFLDDLERLCAQRRAAPLVTTGDIMKVRTFEQLPAGGLEKRTRAMLKVEDGCVNFCAYCVIPYARGPVRSLPADRAAAEAARLAAEGYRELVVTGIEISSWGRDLPGRPPLEELIEAICAAAPGCRIRLGSLEPRTVTEAFCRRVSHLHNLCPHFHLSLQSGCDATLKRMARKYDTARYYESVELLRRYFPDPGLTTDLITGFPGETDGEFDQTLAFIRRCAFSAMHVFPYSRRTGTPAADMPDQVPNALKHERARRAIAAAEEMEGAYLRRWVGRELRVLFEEEVPGRPGTWRGHAPNYVEVYAPGADLHNAERPVQIAAVEGDHLLGELSDEL